MNKSKITTLAVCVIFGFSAHAQNLLLNGSFESPVIPSNSQQVMTPTSWTVGVDAHILNGNYGAFPYAQEGQQSVALANSPAFTLSQQFNVTSQIEYVLRWFDSTAHEPETVPTPYSVAVLTDTLQTVASMNLDAFHPEDWRERSLNITLSPGTYTLRFTPYGNGPGGYATVLDIVTLEPSSSPPSLAADWVYWSNNAYREQTGTFESKIQRAHLDGTGAETVLTGAVSGRFGGIAFDSANGHLYSGDWSYLFRANLDGTGRVNLVPTTVTDVELDLVHGRVYWSDFSSIAYSAKLDGSDVQALVSTPNTEGLALDPAAGKFYFRTGNSEISVANLDGSGQSVFIALPGGSDLFDMELDLVARKIYWNEYYQGDHSLERIWRANLDGPPISELVLVPPTGLANGMCWDAVTQKLYYTGNTLFPHVVVHNGPFDILRVNGDGTQLETVIHDPDETTYVAVLHGDTEPPSITCPGNITVPATGPGGAAVTFAPIATDNFPGVSVVCDPASGTVFPIGTTTVMCTATDGAGNASSCSFTVTVTSQVPTVLGPSQVWIGLKNSDDVGTKFDLRAELYKNGSLVGSGQLDSIAGGSSGFNNAVLRTINTALLATNVVYATGDTLSYRLSVRIAVNVTGHSSGTARLWFNDTAANSHFDATLAGAPAHFYLLNGFALGDSAGPGPKKTIDVLVNKNVGGNPFKPFGTWSKTF